MNKLFLALRVFQKGAMVANPAGWKNTAIIVSFLSALSSLAVAMGWLPDAIDKETLQAIGGGIVAVISVFVGGVHVASSEKVGLPTKTKGVGEAVRSTKHHALDDS